MNYTKCLKCESEWKSKITVTHCPFCLAELGAEPTEFDKIEKAMAFIIKKYEKDVVNDHKRFIALLSDYIQLSTEDRYILDFTMKSDIISELISIDVNNADAKKVSRAKALHKLNILNPALAEKAVDWCTFALGWNDTEIKEPAKKISEPIHDLTKAFVNINPGDIVKYGSYPCDAHGKDQIIEWKVIHVEGERALLLSTKCLDVQPFNSNTFFGNSWEKSSLRIWLNSTFKDAAFDPEQQQQIIKTGNRPSYNPRSGKSNGYSDVMDDIFILSCEDIKNYSLSMKDLAASPTMYAISKKIFSSTVDNTAYWWLRSPGYASSDSMIITHKGRKDELGINVSSKNCGVRPAMWVCTEAFR